MAVACGSRQVIDLAQSDNDSDIPDKVQPAMPGPPSVVPARPLHPLCLAPPPFHPADPFSLPLINLTHSLAYAFSPSTIDPFSSLLKLLHQRGDHSIFMRLTQTLGSHATPTDLLEPLYSIIERQSESESNVRHLALESLALLSVNNAEFARGILANVLFLLEVSAIEEEAFLEDILRLFEVLAEYADEAEAAKIVESVHTRALLRFSLPARPGATPIRELCLAVLKSLARFGNVFPDAVVEEIAKRCNQPKAGVMWPSVVAVAAFLRQPESRAYAVLIRKCDELIARLGLAVIACEKLEPAELKIVVMKVFLEVCDEFRVDDLQASLTDLHINLTAVLISMKHFAENPVKLGTGRKVAENKVRRMAENVLKRFNMS
jgi:hypothetical protein